MKKYPYFWKYPLSLQGYIAVLSCGIYFICLFVSHSSKANRKTKTTWAD